MQAKKVFIMTQPENKDILMPLDKILEQLCSWYDMVECDKTSDHLFEAIRSVENAHAANRIFLDNYDEYLSERRAAASEAAHEFRNA